MHNISSRDKEALSQETTNRNAKIVRLGTLRTILVMHYSGMMSSDWKTIWEELGRSSGTQKGLIT